MPAVKIQLYIIFPRKIKRYIIYKIRNYIPQRLKKHTSIYE